MSDYLPLDRSIPHQSTIDLLSIMIHGLCSADRLGSRDHFLKPTQIILPGCHLGNEIRR